MTDSKNVAVFGLGSMGYGIATSILRAGFTTYGFDVTPERVESFVSEGGASGKLTDVAPKLNVAVVVVLNAAQANAVLFGEDGIVPRMTAGSCIISCSTVPPDFAREMGSHCARCGVLYLDAPISGGSVKAAVGQLTMMASGSPKAFSAARPILDAMAETVIELGEALGAASAMKAVNQLLAGVHIASMAEAVTFGMTQGIEPAQTIEVISKCAGTSWMFENRGPHIVSGDYTPHSSVNIWLKDLGIVLDIAKDSNFSAPLTAAALEQFVAAADSGLGGEDDAAVAKVYARKANLKLPGEN
jgi:L-threonate 2-dehydrogenase